MSAAAELSRSRISQNHVRTIAISPAYGAAMPEMFASKREFSVAKT